MRNKFNDNTAVLWRYIEMAASQMPGAILKGDEIQLKCNVDGCDDHNNKRRGYLIWYHDKDMVYYKCFNYGDCSAAGEGNAIGGKRWLRTYHPAFYKQYITEILSSNNKSGVSADDLSKKKVILKKKISDEEKVLLAEEKSYVKHFKPLTNTTDPLVIKAKEFITRRMIPEKYAKDFFVCTDGKYYGRIIIPFYGRKNEILYYQARDLVGREPKYLNRKLGKDKALFQGDLIDKKKPVVVLEGPIDAMFIENAVATMGVSIKKDVQKKLNKMNCHYLLDNDTAGFLLSIKLLKQGKPIFLWKKFIKDYKLPDKCKDINDTYIYLNKKQQFTFEELSEYFTTNILDQIYLR